MVVYDNYGGVYYNNSLLHATRWYVFVNENENLIKSVNLVELLSHDGKKVL